MRKTNYICDICNKDIKPHKRVVKGSLGIEQTKDCFYAITFKEFSPTLFGTNDVTFEKTNDICSECQIEITKFLHTRKTNATESPVKKYIDPNDMLENQINLFNEI